MQTAHTLTVPTAKRPSHERKNNANIIISSKNYAISTVLQVLGHLAQWHNVLAFRTSGTFWDLREPQGHPGKLRYFRDDPLACWHTSAMLTCWHTCLAQQTDPWNRKTNDDSTVLSLRQPQTHRQMWSVSQFHRLMQFMQFR